MSKIFFVIVTIGMIFTQTALGNAQESSPEADFLNAESLAPKEIISSREEVEGKKAAPSVTQSGNVSLDFREADIRNVLQILALKSGVNVVASPEVSGLISIQLKDVPWQQALEVILETAGYAYHKKGNIILVTTVENLKKRREDTMQLAAQEPLETRTFTLNFGKASEVVQSIEKMKSDRGHIDFDARTNTLIVTDVSQNTELIAGVIVTLDTTTPQVLIEAKIVETTLSDSENLGIDWTLKATISGMKRPITWPFHDRTVDNEFVPDAIPSAASTEFTFGTLDFSQAKLVFEMLKSRSDTNILSSPHIATLDNKAAQIIVGRQYPIPTYTYNEDQAKLQISGWEYKDIGIIFNVTPHVNKAGFVTLDVEPKITAILGFVTVENTSLPELSNESTKTSVMIQDGETLVIGGLLKDQKTNTRKRVPILGDIPILGLAFQKKEDAVAKTDLMVFITPHIITPQIPSE